MEGVIGVVTCFAGTFAPRNWAYCNGQLLPIAQNQALFAILGTTFGGNGTTTFALPNLQGRAALHFGTGFILADRLLEETDTVDVSALPASPHLPHSRPDAAANVDP